MRLSIQRFFLSFFLFTFLLISQWAMAFSFHTYTPSSSISKFIGPFQASPFSLVPYGTLPTQVVKGGAVTAYYSITNKYSKALSGAIESYPKNTTLVTSGSGICPQSFILAAGASCLVQLTVTGAVDNFPTLYVCDSTRVNCVGNGNNPLLVSAISVVSLSISPANASIPKGEVEQYQALATYSDGSTSDVTDQVTWASSNSTIATIGPTGLASGVGVGNTLITASLYGVSTSARLNVTSAALSSISVIPTNGVVGLAKTLQYTARGTYSDGTVADITSIVAWSSSDTTVATISSAGVATGIAPGNAAISASLSGVTKRVNLTVTDATLLSVTLAPTSASIPAGTTQQFTATAHFNDGKNYNVTTFSGWHSSNTTQATVQTLGDLQPGLATGVASGTPTIAATYEGKTGQASLNVTATSLSTITITPTSPHASVGQTVNFTATGTYHDGSTADITTLVTWNSSNTAAVTISNTSGTQGQATAVATGSSTISATLDSVIGSTPMTVKNAVLTSIEVTPANQTVAKGRTVDYKAEGTYSDGTKADITNAVTWTSSVTTVATITSGGVATVVGSSGSTTIQATSGSVQGYTQLTAAPPALTSIAVTPQPPDSTIPNGESVQYTATGTYSDSSTKNITTSVTWSSSNTAIITVANGSSAGLVTAHASSGSATVTAAVGAIKGSSVVTATAAVVTSVVVTPNPANNVVVGETLQFTAIAHYSDASTQTVTNVATWSSGNENVATVSNTTGSNGLALAITPGTTNMTATYLGVSGFAVMHVVALQPVSLSVQPSTVTLPAGDTHQMAAIVTFNDGLQIDEASSSTWSSSVPSNDTVNATGLVTAVTTTGSSAITAQFSLNGATVSGSATVNNTAATLVSVTVTPSSVTKAKGLSQQFTATATYSDASTQDVTQGAAWSSSNTSVASITTGGTQPGYATAEASSGTATITATYNGQSGTASFTAAPAALQSITVTPATDSLIVGQSVSYTATGHYSDNTTQDLTLVATWASSNTAVATMSGSTATAVSSGTTTISATSSGVTGHASLTVSAGVAMTVGEMGATLEPLAYFADNVSGTSWSGPLIPSTTSYSTGKLNRVRFFSSYARYFSVGTATVGDGTQDSLVYSTNGKGEFNAPILIDGCTGGASVSAFTDVTQGTGTTLIAVGNCDFQTPTAHFEPMSFTSSDGTTWTASAAFPSDGPQTAIYGVACETGTASCRAVGGFEPDLGVSGSPIIYTSSNNGASWITQFTPVTTTQGQLNAIAWNGTHFLTVGFGGTPGQNLPIVFISKDVNNDLWDPVTISLINQENAYLNDISCALGSTERYCVSVGAYTENPNTNPLLAPLVYVSTDAGQVWSNPITPTPIGTGNSQLYGVSCSGDNCLAVGTTNDSTATVTYYSSDDGHTWAAGVSLPNTSTPARLAGVAYGP